MRARVLSTHSALNRRLAIARLGVTLAFEAHVRDALARGELVRVLQKFCEPFPGYYLYYPQRRHASRALRALIDHVRGWRQTGRSRKGGPIRPERAARSSRSLESVAEACREDT